MNHIISSLVQWLAPWFCNTQIACSNPVGKRLGYELHEILVADGDQLVNSV